MNEASRSAYTDWPFDDLESNVRTYCRRFPAVFSRAQGHLMWDSTGKCYVDFISGAGALNYGHNHPALKHALINYLLSDGPVQSLDLHTEGKGLFLTTLQDVILGPRGLDYKVQFTGPTGANTVEAAFKVARRATGRETVIAFTNGFHGGSLGALAASSNRSKRRAAGTGLGDVVHMPYEGYLHGSFDTAAYLEAVLDDPSSGVDLPAAIVLETVQGEGGLGTASTAWLQRIAEIAASRGILLIVDDIQAGCGRTGTFFSFEEAGITPDLVCLAKSIGGYGLPLGITLVKPQYDVLEPGAHAGTFRGQNLSFIAGAAALDLWSDPEFARSVADRADQLDQQLTAWSRQYPLLGPEPMGRGMFRGLAFAENRLAGEASQTAFERGLLLETSGARGHVLKVMPPITIGKEDLATGLDLLEDVLRELNVEK